MTELAIIGSKVKLYTTREVATINSFELDGNKKAVAVAVVDKSGEMVELTQDDYNKTWGILNVVEVKTSKKSRKRK